MNTLLEVKGLKKYFPIKSGFLRSPKAFVHAVDGVSFQVKRGETFALVGESGCGKTTVGNCILRLIDPTDGSICFDGEDLAKLSWKELWRYRSRMQVVFQNPYASLNPRKTIGQILGYPFKLIGVTNHAEVERNVLRLLARVGLRSAHMYRYPYEFSGGQRQRIAIARAIATNAEFVFLDEPTSSLDVSVQAQLLNLLKELQAESNLTYLLVTHNIEVVRHLADNVAVMYLGKVMEMAGAKEIFENPLHPYTQALFSAIPSVDPTVKKQRIVLSGEPPTSINPRPGCRFYGRCWMSEKGLCDAKDPPLLDMGSGHIVACHFAEKQMEAARQPSLG